MKDRVEFINKVLQISDANLIKQMKRQICFLERSCEIFDKGERDEAIRIAVTLRTLIHDTSHSTSLLRKIKLKEILVLASSCELIPIKDQKLSFENEPESYINGIRNGQVIFARDSLTTLDENKIIQPILAERKSYINLSIEDWWNKFAVVVLPMDNYVSRKQIVLAAANKDGGTHVDSYPQKYDQLDKGFWQTNGEMQREHQFVLLRQFAFELLNSPDIKVVNDFCNENF